MEETLKSMRLVHRVLLTVIVAIFLFALSPDRERQQKLALGFLDQLKAFPADRYEVWAERIASDHLLSRNAYLAEVFQNVKNQGGPMVDWSAFRHSEDDELAAVMTVGQFGPRIEGGTLESINASFRDDIPVRDIVVPASKLASKILVELDREKTYTLDNFVFTGTAGIGRFDLQLYLYDSENNLESVTTTIKVESGEIEGQSLRTWMTQNGYADLVAGPDEQGLVFPSLGPIWPFVRNMKISEAKDWIHQELLRAGESNTLSVLGFSVAEGQAAVIAPAMTLALLLILTAYSQHTRGFESEDFEGIVASFPWICLFRGILGICGRLLTLVILPLASNAWLLTRAEGTAARFGWCLWVLLLPSTVWLWFEIRELVPVERSSPPDNKPASGIA